MQNPVPATVAEHLPLAIAHAKADMAPCGQKAAAVLLRDLWAVFPMPANEAADRIWNETLAQYPADLVKAAISRLIATRTWDRDAPVPGQVIALLKAEHSERMAHLPKLEAMQTRYKLDGMAGKPPSATLRDQPKEARAAFLEGLRSKYPDGFRQASHAASVPDPTRDALD